MSTMFGGDNDAEALIPAEKIAKELASDFDSATAFRDEVEKVIEQCEANFHNQRFGES